MQIRLEQICLALPRSRIKIDISFLRSLLSHASRSPTHDRMLARTLGCVYNDDHNVCPQIVGWWSGRKSLTLLKLRNLVELTGYNWRDVEKQVISIRAGQHDGEIKPTFPIELNEDSGCVIGHILGDGSLDSRYQQVFFTNLNNELLSEFSVAMNRIFGIEPRIWIQQAGGFNKSKWVKRINHLNEKGNYQGGLFYPSICGRILLLALGKFADGEHKQITSEIRSASPRFKRSLLRAFFDDEGTVDTASQMIRVFQKDRRLLSHIRLMIAEFGIHPNPIRFYLRNGNRQHYFSITHIKNYYLFAKRIGFTSSSKTQALDQMINHAFRSHKYKNLQVASLEA